MFAFDAKINQTLEDKAKEIVDQNKSTEDCKKFKTECEKDLAGRNYCGFILQHMLDKLTATENKLKDFKGQGGEKRLTHLESQGLDSEEYRILIQEYTILNQEYEKLNEQIDNCNKCRKNYERGN